jgi:diguanylate cyclase (GGDEF)-like protein
MNSWSTLVNARSFTFRMTCVVTLLVLIACFLVATLSQSVAERQMAGMIGDQQYALLTSTAESIDKNLDSKKMVLELVAQQLAALPRLDAQAIQKVFESHPPLREEFYNVVAFDPQGVLIANLSDRTMVDTIRVGNRPYFKDTLKDRDGVISAPFRSNLSGTPVVLITKPVFDLAGKLLFVLAGGIDLHRPRLFAQLQSLAPGQSGYLFLLSRDGVVLQYPDQKRLLQRVDAQPAMASMFQAMRSSDGWARGVTEHGRPAIWSFHRLRNADWILGAVFPELEAFAPLDSMRRAAFVSSAIVALAAGVVGCLAIFRLLRPLGALRRHVSRIAAGDADIAVFDVRRQDEFGELSRAFYALSCQRAKAEADLAAIASTDRLTGIPNRRMFDLTLPAALARASREQGIIGLAYLDVDHFKAINDTHGHGIGDEVLVEFAARLKRAVRISDTVARLAGDEFVIIFEQIHDHTLPYLLAEKILAAVRAPFVLSGVTLQLTTSVGIALRPAGQSSPAALLAAADAALYQAKQAGRNGFVVSPAQ